MIWFPKGKGDPCWQEQESLFLGIDHTAIAIKNTESSRTLYAKQFGMRVVGERLNYGPQQEHLNSVFGCRVRITGWRPAPSKTDPKKVPVEPGIEFLEYQAPPGGRAMPEDTQPNDRWHWETTLPSDDIEAEFNNINPSYEKLISSRIVQLPDDNTSGFR